jgi:hypothetical protein
MEAVWQAIADLAATRILSRLLIDEAQTGF